MKNCIGFWAFTGMMSAGLMLGIGTAGAQTQARAGEVNAVVELFTSQGCSSCPPADALLVELAREKNVVALTYNVDIWDYLGWKDTLASPAFTKRQRGYGRSLGDRQIYTPQAVINGRMHVVGSDFAGVTRARSTTRGVAGVLAVPVSVVKQGKGWMVRVGASDVPGSPSEIVLLPIERQRTVPIGRGENTGRSVTYANVVREIVPLGPFDGTAREFAVSTDKFASLGADAFAVLVQVMVDGKPSTVLGAAISPAVVAAAY